MYKDFFKRLFDLIIALIVLVTLLPIILIIFVLLFFTNGGSPLFFQDRPGKDKKIFRLVKFKTMSERRDSNGKLLPDKERLTPIGRFIRSTSMDELAQLINFLKGDMSLIGPRPLLIKHLHLYNVRQARRREVRPGITDFTILNVRNA